MAEAEEAPERAPGAVPGEGEITNEVLFARIENLRQLIVSTNPEAAVRSDLQNTIMDVRGTLQRFEREIEGLKEEISEIKESTSGEESEF